MNVDAPPPIAVHPNPLVTIPLAATVLGLTQKAIRNKIATGVWIEGREYHRAPDGRIFVNLPSVNRWVVQGQGSRSGTRASESA